MKKMMICGLCLITTATVCLVKNTRKNEDNLGVAKVVMAKNEIQAYQSMIPVPTTLVNITALVSRRIIDLEETAPKIQVQISAETDGRTSWWLNGETVERILSNVELKDEMDSKLKTL